MASTGKIPRSQFGKISKFLSFVLRHKPDAIGLTLDAQGWASVSELIEKASSEVSLTADLIKQTVVTNDKHRFSLSADEQKIRVNQGHSIKIDLDLIPKEPPSIL